MQVSGFKFQVPDSSLQVARTGDRCHCNPDLKPETSSGIILPEAESNYDNPEAIAGHGFSFCRGFGSLRSGKYYSPSLVLYVVEQSLMQKAPSGIDPASFMNVFTLTLCSSGSKAPKWKGYFEFQNTWKKCSDLSFEQTR